MRTMRCPAPLNSGDVTRSTGPTAVANDTSVGGTSKSSNDPLMESLPPMAPTPRSTCAMSAPSTAATGLPQRSGTSRNFSKYSWNVRYMSARANPEATSFATLSTTATYDPANGSACVRYGLKPHAMPLAVVVSPSTGSLAAMASAGVSWRDPPNGMSTVPAPMVESKRSDSPLFEHTLRSETSASMRSASEPPSHVRSYALPGSTRTSCCFGAPLDAKNARLTSTMVCPRHVMRTRASSVTPAMGVASRFSSRASAKNASTSSAANATAMRSWLSEMASSVPSKPSYFLGTRSRSMSRPSASSPTATDTPPAPKSLQRLMRRHASPRRNRR